MELLNKAEELALTLTARVLGFSAVTPQLLLDEVGDTPEAQQRWEIEPEAI